MSADVFTRLLVWAVPVVFAIVCHEVSHGWMAYRLGDDTAKRMGRLTLNPLPHIDPLGTVILPAIMIFTGGPVFGWAKPVPYNPYNFRRGVDIRRGSMMVALAGPVINLILGLISSFLLFFLHSLFRGSSASLLFLSTAFFEAFMVVNVVLACFNLMPIPPLDGSKVLMGLLPAEYARYFMQLERYGFLILIILLSTGVLSRVIWKPIDMVLRLFYAIPGFLF